MGRWAFALAIALLALGPAAAQERPELSSVRLAVGGRSGLFYLPLTVTERLGYFKQAGLDVEIADVQAGVRALQAVVAAARTWRPAPSITPSRCRPSISRWWR